MHREEKLGAEEQNAILRQEDFWFGYRRGVNRFLHGKIFADKEELDDGSESGDSSPDGSSPLEIARCNGYRSGCAGLTVEEAAVNLRKLLQLLDTN
jgi:hypothetical protein